MTCCSNGGCTRTTTGSGSASTAVTTCRSSRPRGTAAARPGSKGRGRSRHHRPPPRTRTAGTDVRRTGLTGDIWPDEIQELLLRAALLPPPAGAAAWAAARPRIDVDRLPGELHRLIPLLSKALAARGVEDPELPRLKGVYQYSWYRNQLLLADGAALVSALEAAGVSTM